MRISGGALTIALLTLTGSVARARETAPRPVVLVKAAPSRAPPPVRPHIDLPAGLQGRPVVAPKANGSIEGKHNTSSEQRVFVNGASGSAAGLAPMDNEVPATGILPPAPADDSLYPWGFWIGTGLGPAWGQSSGSISPTLMGTVDLGVSYHFVYVGTGLAITWFGGSTLSSDTPTAVGGYVEAGVIKGLFFPYSATESFELRPGVAYGLMAMSDAKQGIDDCEDCDPWNFHYNGAHYVRFQLGVYRAVHPEGSSVHHVLMAHHGSFLGGAVSFQKFVFGARPRLDQALTFAFVWGWGD